MQISGLRRLNSELLITMHLPGTVEWLHSTNCAILTFRWMDVDCCPRSFPNADRDDHCSNVSALGRDPKIHCSNVSALGRDPKIHCSNVSALGGDPKICGRSINLESMRCTTSDGGDGATFAGLREASDDEDIKLNFASKEAMPDCNSGECPQDQTRCCPAQEFATVVSEVDESLDWREEKKQWIRAAGVSTPSELKRKLEDMRRAATQNETQLKKLACHVAEVKTFLLELHDIDEYFVKRKRRCERSSRKRKRFRRRCAAMECCFDALSDNHESSTERLAPEQGSRSLLDPEIMRSFGSLIKSPA